MKIDNKLTITLPAFDMMLIVTAVQVVAEKYPTGGFGNGGILKTIVTQIAHQMNDDIKNELDMEFAMNDALHDIKGN